jgi:undecaprenyl-diphosphatase
MLDWIQVVALSLVQGLTEFLPISSSAHLILVPYVLGWPDQGLSFDVAVHLGTFFAVFSYFRKDIAHMVKESFNFTKSRALGPHAKLLLYIGLATIPVGLAGLAFKDFIESHLRTPIVIAYATIGFGLCLWWAASKGQQTREINQINWRDILVIGGGQVLALIPGTSRSGITLTAGLAQGLSRESAARFSFLLSLPLIALAASYQTFNLMKENTPIQWDALGWGVLLSAISGYVCIHVFLKLLAKVGVLPFVLYRLVLGSVLLLLFA